MPYKERKIVIRSTVGVKEVVRQERLDHVRNLMNTCKISGRSVLFCSLLFLIVEVELIGR